MFGPRFVFAALFLVVLPHPASTRTWHVVANGSGDAPTIRAALDSAASGDEILVGPGTYTWTSENATGHSMIQLKPDVVLRSESGPESTILDAERIGRVILVRDASTAQIQGFTVQHGVGIPPEGLVTSLGGGIYSFGDSRPLITNCIVRENEAWSGAGVYCTEAGAEIIECDIVENRARPFEVGPGGIFCENAVISACRIRDNFAFGRVGGILAHGSTVTDCVIEGNRAQTGSGASGGGAGGSGGTMFRLCLFRNNMVVAPSTNASGGGLMVTGECSVIDCVFVENFISAALDAYGAAIGGDRFAKLIVDRCTILANTAVASDEEIAGIYVDPRGSGTVTSSMIVFNTGAATWADPIQFSCTNVFGNTRGDEIMGVDVGGNFSEDPQFCSVNPVGTADYTLQDDSPCAPGRHPHGDNCGLIGAAPIQCGGVGVESRTWGEIKSLYRG